MCLTLADCDKTEASAVAEHSDGASADGCAIVMRGFADAQ